MTPPNKERDSRRRELVAVLEALESAVPTTTLSFARAVGPLRRGSFSFEVLERDLAEAGLKNPFVATTLNAMQVIVRRAEVSRVEAIDRVINDRRRYSVQSLPSISAAASWRGGANALRRLLDATGGIAWLDSTHQWLWVTGSTFETCRLQREMAKLACGAEWISTPACASALRRLFKRQSPVPSAAVLEQAIPQWEWLQSRAGCVRPMIGIDPRLVFRPAELAIYSVLQSEPEGIPRAELVVRCELQGIRPHTTYRVVRKAPWVTVGTHGVRLTRSEAACSASGGLAPTSSAYSDPVSGNS